MIDTRRTNPLPLALVLTALLGGSGGAVCAATEQDYLRQAEELQAKGELRGAIIQLKNALQADPGLLEARLLLGQLYLKTGDGAGAEKEIRRAQAIGADPAASTIALGDALLLQRAFERLLDEIQPDLVERPQDRAVILRQRGEAMLLLGRTRNGCELFEESNGLDRNYAPTYRGLAQCALLNNDERAAYVYLNDALALDDGDADTWIALGNLRLSGGEPQLAIDAYTEAAERDTVRVDALLSRAQVHLQQQQPELARADVEQMRARNPRFFGADFIDAQLAYQAGDRVQARESLERALAANPAYPPARLMNGALSFEEGQHEQAAEVLRAYLAQVPGNMDARVLLASAYLALGTVERANDLITPLLDAGNKDPRLLRIAGETKLRLGDTAAAVPLLEQAAEQLPDDAALRTRLGNARLLAGDADQGIEDLEAASILGADAPQAQADIALAYQYLARKDYKGALRVLANAERKLPDNPGAYNLRGLAYLGKGAKAQARQSFERALALRPTLVSAAVRLAQMDLADNDPVAAKGRYLTVLEHDKGSIAAMVGVAEVEQQQGHDDAYVDWLKRAAGVGPRALTPRLLLARHYADNNDLVQALAMAQEAVEGRPESADAWALLGDLQMRTSGAADARTSYQRLVALAPDSAAAHQRLAVGELARGNDSAARDALRAALQLEPQDVQTLRMLYDLEQRVGDQAEAGSIAEQLRALGIDAATGKTAEGTMRIGISGASGDPEEVKRAVAAVQPSLIAVKRHQDTVGTDEGAADAALLGWLTEHPDDRIARTYLADSYLRRQRTPAAIEQYEALLKQDANNLLALNNLAVLYQQNGDARAIELARRLYGLAPDDANYADTLGWMLVQQGETAEGLPLLEQAARGAPDNPEIGLHLAEALLKTGDDGGARAELNRVGRGKLAPALDARRRQLLESLSRSAAGPN